MILKFLLPHLIVRAFTGLFRKKKLDARILSLRKEVAATLADTSMSDDLRLKLILDLRRQIDSLEAQRDA